MSFSVNLMLQKAVKSGIKALIGIIIGFIGADNLVRLGVQIDPEALAVGLSVLIVGVLEGLRNLLKTKYKIGWL